MRSIFALVGALLVAAVIALGVRNHFLVNEAPLARGAPAVEPAAPAADPAVPPADELWAEEPTAASPGTTVVPAGPPTAAAPGPVAPAQPAPAAGSPPAAALPAPPQVTDASQEAAEILRRAAAAYGNVQTLRADFVQRIDNPLLRSSVTSRGTIFQRRPDRFLMRFSDPEGDVIVSDGVYFWVYYPSVDARQVMRARAAAGSAGAVDLQAQFLGDPVRRFDATLHGAEEVAGRRAQVLTLRPREAAPYRQLKVWIDASDHLVRRFEITEETGAVRRFELSNLQVNGRLADDLFQFTPPAGAQVIDRG
jgi:outer membrane lipoprotein carrier protein